MFKVGSFHDQQHHNFELLNFERNEKVRSSKLILSKPRTFKL